MVIHAPGVPADPGRTVAIIMNKSHQKNGWMVFFLPVCVLILIDQVSKLLAAHFLKGQPSLGLIPGVFELFYLENRGAAFGMFKGRQLLLAVLALAITGFAAWICIRVLPPTKLYRPLQVVCIMLSAGALGNMIDRLWHHYVIDFLYFSLINFPVFNIADVYVCVSCAALIFLILFRYREEDLQRLR